MEPRRDGPARRPATVTTPASRTTPHTGTAKPRVRTHANARGRSLSHLVSARRRAERSLSKDISRQAEDLDRVQPRTTTQSPNPSDSMGTPIERIIEPDVRFVIGSSPLVADGDVQIVKKAGRVAAKFKLQVSVHNRNPFPITVSIGEMMVPLTIQNAVPMRAHGADGTRFMVSVKRQQWETSAQLFSEYLEVPAHSVSVLKHKFQAGELYMSSNKSTMYRFFACYRVSVMWKVVLLTCC